MKLLPNRKTLTRLLSNRTYAEVGAMYGVTKQAVQQAYGSVNRSHRWRTAMQSIVRPNEKEIRALLRSGMLGTEVARKFGFPAYVLSRLLTIRDIRPLKTLTAHGTTTCYTHGCHCKKCRKAAADYRRNLYHRKKEARK